jgi:hypothetical protein
LRKYFYYFGEFAYAIGTALGSWAAPYTIEIDTTKLGLTFNAEELLLFIP